MSKNKVVAVVSGGMDSVSLLYRYKDSITHVLNFDYGSKHNEREQHWACYHSFELSKHFTVIKLPFIADLFASALLKSGGDIPLGHYQDPSMRKTVVPFRNGIMLSIAAGFAESVGCNIVALGNHFGDHEIYPDCRASFVNPMAEAIREGTYSNIELFAPFTNFTKREVAEIGKAAGVDFSKTYTCYQGREKHCGFCGSCTERKEALAGFDTTEYETV